jgi:hypothetical protein
VPIVRDERFRKNYDYLLKHILGFVFVNLNTWHLICNNFNLKFICDTVCLYVCVCAFSLRRESPNVILGDKPLISEVVLSQFQKSWSDCMIGNIRLQLAVAREVLLRLESAGDQRQLAAHETVLHRELKLKTLVLSSLRRTIARQESRILWIKEGDVPTTFFHAHANARQRHNHIRVLKRGDQTFLSEEDKVVVVFNFFNHVLDTPPLRTCRLKLEALDLPSLDLTALGDRFIEAEVWSVIKEMTPDKASGPNGFIARFFQATWPVIRHDFMLVFDVFWRLDTRHLHSTNDALIVLLPKSADAESMKEFRPIALIHPVGKIIAKVLANRLAPKLDRLVHVNQNAFVKGCFIHDSFKLMQASAKQLHARKVACLLLKIDIARAFDSVPWPFLL